MQMSQIWSKADFDGLNETGHKGDMVPFSP